MNPTAIKDYISRLPYNATFTDLTADIQDKIMFGASEMLRRRYGADAITDEMIALQSLYMAEGENEEFAMFKRQGVKTVRLDEINFTFDGNSISPEVVALVESQAGAGENSVYFGRLL